MPTPQQQINYGNTANDGQGDPLRTAFIKVDDNFDAIWNAGPVGSNVTILNNIISTVNTNGNLTISANGVGVIETRSTLVPRLANSYDLGSAGLPYRSVFVGSGGATVSGNITVGAVLTDNYLYANGAPFSPGSDYGNSNVANFLPIYDGNIGANTALFTGNIALGGNINLFGNTFHTLGNFNQPLTQAFIVNLFAANVQLGNLTSGNIDAGITLTDTLSAGTVFTDKISWPFPLDIETGSGNNIWQFAGNILRGPQGDTWQSSVDTTYINSPANGYVNISSLVNDNVVSELFMEHSFIRLFIDNGIDATWEFQADGRTAFPRYTFPYEDGNAGEVLKTDGTGNLAWATDTTDYGNANVEALGESGWSGNIIPQGNGVYSLGNATNYWSNLFVASNTIFIGGVPLGIGAGNTLTVNGEALLSNDSNTSITTTGNITADYFIGDGSQLTNLPFDASQIENGTSNVAIATANGNVTVTADSTQTWTFGTSGNLRFPDGTTYTGSELVSATVPTVGGTASAGEEGIIYSGKIAIFQVDAFTVGEWTDVQVGWTVTDNDGFTDTIASRGGFGAASFVTTENNWPAPASGKTYVFTSPDYQPGYTDPIEITVGSDTWTFGNTGALTVPGNTVTSTLYTDNNGYRLNLEGNLNGVATAKLVLDNDSGFIRLIVGNVSTPATWAFRDNGNLTFPGGGLLGQVWGDGADNELTLKSPTAGGASAYVALSSANEKNYVEVSNGGTVVAVDFGTEGFKKWEFDTTGNLTVAGNINFGGDASAGPSLNDFASVTSAANFAVVIDSADSAPTWSFETGDGALGEFDESPLLRTPAGAGSVIYNETLMAILAGNIDAGERSSVRLEDGGVALLGTSSLGGELSTIIFEVNTGGVGIRALGDAAPRLSVVGNITGGNILTAGSVSATGNVTGGNISTAGAVSATGNLSANNVSTGNITATRLQNDANLEIRSNVAGTVKVWTFDAIGDLNLARNISGAGNINIGNVNLGGFLGDGNITSDGNIIVKSGTFPVTFDNTGNVTVAGNLTVSGTAGNVVTKYQDFWTVPTGNSTQSFTVDSNNTYQMWVEGNIPNGIIAWNATATVTNTNVPVLGQQFAWNYEGGGNVLLFNSIPNQFVGTAGTISNAEPVVANTNVFTFGINNASGSNATVRYGWIRIS
jgi:hypothetical protein